MSGSEEGFKFGKKLLELIQSEREPKLIIKKAKAIADAKRHLAITDEKLEEDIKKFREGKLEIKGNEFVLPDNLKEVVSARVIERELRQEQNLNKTYQKVLEYSEEMKDEEVSDEKISEDWFVRWKNGAQDISDEKIQDIWARTLAEEIKTPKSFSFRTIDFLKSLSKYEASLIEKALACCTTKEFVLPYYDSKTEFIKLEELIELEQIGFLTGASAGFTGMNYTWHSVEQNKYVSNIFFKGKFLTLESPEANKVFSTRALCISKIGKEISKLSETQINLAYFRGFAQHIKSKGYKVVIGDYSQEVVDGFVKVFNVEEV